MTSKAAAQKKPLPYANKGNLTKGDVGQHLMRLTVPMVWGIFAVVSFQLVDTYFISMLGHDHLTAISFTFPITYVVFSLTMAMGIAMSSVLARQIGEGNEDRVRRITTHGIMFAFLTGSVIALLGVPLINPLFAAMGADADSLVLIREYMWIWFAGSVFLTVPLVGNTAIRATGDTRVPAMIMTIVAVVNVILDPILIFGLFGFPRMEMQGAALATVIANFCAMVAGLYVVYFKKHLILRDGLRFDKFSDSVRRLAVIAVPVGVTSALLPISNAVIIALLATQSEVGVAVFGVASRLESFAFVVIMALATGMAPIIGQNWGAKLYDRVHDVLKKAFGFAFAWSLGVGILAILSAKFIGGLFSDEADFVAMMQLYFMIVALTYAPGNLVQGWSSAFNAVGMPRRSFLMIFVRLIVLQIPLAYIGGAMWGATGIFASIAATNLISGIGFHILNRRVCSDEEKSDL
jgi:putative MATE family efflux protein